jgi:hypothetical protein
MTQPTNPPATVANIEGSDAHDSQRNGAPQLATGTQARLDDEQQTAWLREGPEVFHAPGPRFPPAKTIGLSTLAIVVSGLAVTAMAHILAPGPVSSEIMAPPTAARPATSSALATNAPPTVPPAPMATNVTSSTAPDAPVSPTAPALTLAAPTPEEHLPIAGSTTERRSNRHGRPASPSSPAPALPEMTATRWPSSDGDQENRAQGAPSPQEQQGQQSQWRWKKTTTCDSSGRCVDHYNPVPSDQ